MNHYELLGLSRDCRSSTGPSITQIKNAYKRALLLHHPDKAHMRKGVSAGDDRSITIDQINLAYRVLSDSSARMEYDRLLRLQTQQPQNDMVKEAPGLETIDLDDMFFDEAQATWYRGCRCGRERAFVVSEQELEQEAQYGEIVLGCDGCSLWLRVTFQVDEEK